ncbi:MAG: YHS domain-containing protein [Alphaproteobacteria bacterium]|nr:YHS domain-containing protein [Alphaproteobacteria bacterium]
MFDPFNLRRRTLGAALILAAAVASPIAFAPPALAGVEINTDAQGVMIHGYDPVAYFTSGQPTKGTTAYSAPHNGGRYLFASAANRDAFVKEPAKYAPQYGGYCAMGTALGKKFDGDPTQWKIVDGKLYLNLNADVAKAWNRDVPGNITKANGNWPRIRDKPAAELNRN